ncbi:MAG TPA: thiamine pyrophosphate-dependent enzyme, partial [Alphaproteobacteria bacterium]
SSWSIACKDIVNRAAAFGMPGVQVDGFDFFAVHEAASKAIARARAGEGPTLLDIKTARFYGHHEGDSQTYRGKDEVQRLRAEKDCLQIFRKKVTDAALLEARQLDAIDGEVEGLIEDAVKAALRSPAPPPEALHQNVYVSY